ncbi:TPA: fimbrial protein [Serratia fonticola]
MHPDSIDQTVDLGQVSDVSLADGGTSAPKFFEIVLEKCNIGDTAKSVSAAFNGAAGGVTGSLGMTGTAKGANIMLTDSIGEQINLAQPTSAQAIQNGNNTLGFTAYLQGDGVITPSDFNSVANFTLAYQ